MGTPWVMKAAKIAHKQLGNSYNAPLPAFDPICYSSRPASAAHEIEQIERVAEKEDVDEERETLHNLTSLLLTNKTIRKRGKAVPNTKFFNN